MTRHTSGSAASVSLMDFLLGMQSRWLHTRFIKENEIGHLFMVSKLTKQLQVRTRPVKELSFYSMTFPPFSSTVCFDDGHTKGEGNKNWTEDRNIRDRQHRNFWKAGSSVELDYLYYNLHPRISQGTFHRLGYSSKERNYYHKLQNDWYSTVIDNKENVSYTDESVLSFSRYMYPPLCLCPCFRFSIS